MIIVKDVKEEQMMTKDTVVNDLVYFKNMKIVQNKDYFNFSLESVLLPNFVEIGNGNKKIMDLCSGNIPIPLILSLKTKSKIYAVEIQKEIYDLAKETLRINGLENQIELINDDAKNMINKYETDTFDIITCNPPYFKRYDGTLTNDNAVKSIARHEIMITIDDIVNISRKLLKNNGALYIVHRTERLSEIIQVLKINNMEPKRIRLIYPKKGRESNLVLIEARKNGKTGLRILSPLCVHNSDGTYTREVISMFSN